MKKRLAAAVLLALVAGAAQATVIKLHSAGGGTFKVYVHNTLIGCDNKKGTVGPPGNYHQMDWRGGCTGSCVDYMLVYNKEGDWCMGKVQIWNQCKTQAITLTGDGKEMPKVTGDFNYTRVDFGMSATKDISRYGCPKHNDSPVPFDGLKN